MAETDQLRLAVGAAQNRNLFPVHFLEQRLPEWPEYADLDCANVLTQLKEIWDRERDLLPSFNEDQTEDRLVRPILGILGFSYTPRPALDVAGRRREPDYALFLDSAGRAEAEAVGGSARYLRAVAVLEAKRFDRPLDRRRASGSLSEDPVAQVIHYVGTTKVPFGILTNGRVWRLYAERGDLIEGAHYEVDLIALLESGDAKALRAFTAFFSASAFRPDGDGRSFLDRVLDESRSNAIAVGDALQRQVFDGLPQIARGLLGDEPFERENLTLAFESSLVFLYRLLFCLHAEARGLLPVESPHYLEYSVRRQRQNLAGAIDGDRKFGHATARLYNELEALFALVDAGDDALGVNEYNGGLFSTAAHQWLAGRAIPDDLLAPALDGLYRLDGQAIDYRDLSVRHLGTIYERLLAYELAPDAESDGLALVEAPGRGDTGSYFTPEPIVDLIIERTLEPLLERRSAAVAEKGLTGDEALDAFLALRVVDPAMGSGHFLVSAAAYIAQFIATDPSYQGDLEWREIQRLVAERCLYGVDLNPMAVELARLALWLSTVSGAEPLTFLGNLRVGNSLVGADVDDLTASTATLFAERLARDAEQLLARVGEIAAQASDSGEAVHEKEATSLAAAALREPLTQVADEVVAPHFTEPVEMFHWELEFPEVFLATDGSLRSDRGFDAVVGNPPYIRIQKLGRELATWCRARFPVAFGSFDAYIVFVDRAAGLLGPEGRLGFIVPNKFLKLESGKKLREALAVGALVEEIVDFGDAQLFEGATNYTCVLVLDASGRDRLGYRKVRGEAAGIPLAREIQSSALEHFEVGTLGDGPWVLVSGRERQLLDALSVDASPLGEVVRQIFQGLITSADPVYIVEDRGNRADGRMVYSKASDRELLLEPDLLHPLASGTEVARYAFEPLGDLLLFPYRRRDREMELLPADELARLALTAAYLGEHETALRGRERGKMDHDRWYGYVYPKSLGLHSIPKLGIPRLCDRLRVAADPDGVVFLDNVDVNGLLPSDDGPDLWVLACLLNSRLLNWVFRLTSVPFRGSYFSANKQFIAPLPIRSPSREVAGLLGLTGTRLHRSMADLLVERAGFRQWLGEVIGVPMRSLPGHTKLAEPDLLALTEIASIVGSSRASLKIDPDSRSFRERLAAEHAKSVEKASELLRVIAIDEAAVDDAIFDLYEVTDSQRTMVESRE